MTMVITRAREKGMKTMMMTIPVKEKATTNSTDSNISLGPVSFFERKRVLAGPGKCSWRTETVIMDT